MFSELGGKKEIRYNLVIWDSIEVFIILSYYIEFLCFWLGKFKKGFKSDFVLIY